MQVWPSSTARPLRIFIGLVWVLLMWAQGSPATAQAPQDGPARVGRVAAVQGGAQLWDSHDRQWTPLMVNRPVTAGDRIRSAADSRVELQIGSLQLFIGPDADVDFAQLDDAGVSAHLTQGALAARVRTAEWTRDLVLSTNEMRAQAVTPGLFRLDRDEGLAARSAAAALRGQMRLLNGEIRVELAQGQRIEVQGPTAASSLRAAPMPSDAFADHLLAQDRAAEPATAWSLASPEITGLEALDRHGRWDAHPEHGWVWSPLAVRADWEPFQDGRWVWIRPWGWTWVDNAPWGFAPSHYGHWLQWRGRWVWSPAHSGPRPVFSPAIGSWGSGGVVVWRSHAPPHRGAWRPLPPPAPPGRHLHPGPVTVVPNRPHDDRFPGYEHRPPRASGEERTVRVPRIERGADHHSAPPGFGGSHTAPSAGAPVFRPTPVPPVSGPASPTVGSPMPVPGRSPGRIDRPDRPDRAERPERPERPDRPPPSEGRDRTERPRQQMQ